MTLECVIDALIIYCRGVGAMEIVAMEMKVIYGVLYKINDSLL